jgi:hypothetical protein
VQLINDGEIILLKLNEIDLEKNEKKEIDDILKA